MPMLDAESAKRQLQAVGRYMMQYELAWGNAGNISAKTGEDRCVISASGTFLGELGDDDVVECQFDGEPVTPGGRKPSKEMPMHRAVYEVRPDVGAVLHASPFYSTLVASTLELEVPSDAFVESMYYLERVERVPYRHPGSQALGDEVRARAGRTNVLLLDNHGALAYDTTIQEARMALQTLEMTCRLLVATRQMGVSWTALPKQVVRDFLDNAGYKTRRRWPS